MYNVIVNTSAKSGIGEKLWNTLKREFDKQRILYQIFETKGHNSATEYVKQILKDSNVVETIVVVGGDGTLNEAVNGCDDFTKVRFAYIPTGSANDFAISAGVPSDIEENIKTIIEQHTIKKLDVGILEFNNIKRKFIVSAGIGFDAAICKEAEKQRIKKILNKLHMGKATYGLIGLKLAITSKKFDIKLDIDDKTLDINKLLFASIHIQPCEGGNYPFCPNADNQDGLFDICTIHGINRLRSLLMFPIAKKGNHINHKGVNIYRTSEVHIKSSVQTVVHTDGEVFEPVNEIKAYMCPTKLQLLMP